LNGTKRRIVNLLKHRISFETAVLAFDDPFALTRHDEFVTEEERWITLASVSPDAVLFIVHTGFEEDGFEEDGEEGTRIISARRATPRERKTYEEAKRAAKTGYRRDFRDERGRH
jgi:uncharacterized DUF497 family protein